MLLNYLFTNFREENDFAAAAGLSTDELHRRQEARLIPAASYILDSNARSVSFVSTFHDTTVYRFHLKGHLRWIEALDRLALDTEARARAYFEQRYNTAKTSFLSGQLGAELAAGAPEISAKFDAAHADATWNEFLDGVYGVCTRDGLPETIFLKQAGVAFIAQMTATGQAPRCGEDLSLLTRAVEFLDSVASPFAPHEVSQSSRQRCIIDVRARFLCHPAA